jgi:hypothetical protein
MQTQSPAAQKFRAALKKVVLPKAEILRREPEAKAKRKEARQKDGK